MSGHDQTKETANKQLRAVKMHEHEHMDADTLSSPSTGGMSVRGHYSMDDKPEPLPGDVPPTAPQPPLPTGPSGPA